METCPDGSDGAKEPSESHPWIRLGHGYAAARIGGAEDAEALFDVAVDGGVWAWCVASREAVLAAGWEWLRMLCENAGSVRGFDQWRLVVDCGGETGTALAVLTGVEADVLLCPSRVSPEALARLRRVASWEGKRVWTHWPDRPPV